MQPARRHRISARTAPCMAYDTLPAVAGSHGSIGDATADTGQRSETAHWPICSGWIDAFSPTSGAWQPWRRYHRDAQLLPTEIRIRQQSRPIRGFQRAARRYHQRIHRHDPTMARDQNSSNTLQLRLYRAHIAPAAYHHSAPEQHSWNCMLGRLPIG